MSRNNWDGSSDLGAPVWYVCINHFSVLFQLKTMNKQLQICLSWRKTILSAQSLILPLHGSAPIDMVGISTKVWTRPRVTFASKWDKSLKEDSVDRTSKASAVKWDRQVWRSGTSIILNSWICELETHSCNRVRRFQPAFTLQHHTSKPSQFCSDFLSCSTGRRGATRLGN